MLNIELNKIIVTKITYTPVDYKTILLVRPHFRCLLPKSGRLSMFALDLVCPGSTLGVVKKTSSNPQVIPKNECVVLLESFTC